MSKARLDQSLVARGLVATRSQAESYIKLGKVTVNGTVQKKPGFLVSEEAEVVLTASERFVSRAALKLASVTEMLHVSFKDKTVLDVGSSTGGFTDYALQHGARKVIAVELGTDQLHPSLRSDERIELYEQTDIRDVQRDASASAKVVMSTVPDVVVMDVSFISLREILPHVATLCNTKTEILAMVKPQFEAQASNLKHKGVIKNDRMRRDILKDFEFWTRDQFVIIDKADSDVSGSKGNVERFYKLKLAS